MMGPAWTVLSLLASAGPNLDTASLPVPADSTAFYVSPKGSDRGPGTQQRPFRTLDRARDAVRGISRRMRSDVFVVLMDGVHYLRSTLVLGSEDSGRNGHRIVYAALAGARPVVSGGVDITKGWTLFSKEKNIYRRTGIAWSFRQLNVNGHRGIRARTPNLEDEVTGGPYARAAGDGRYPLTVKKDELGPWLNGGSVEMVYVDSWDQFRGRVSHVDGDKVIFKDPESGFAYNHHTQGSTPYYFENSLELLDAEGEWFLDDKTQTLYYKPRQGEVMNQTPIVAPRLESLVEIKGRNAEDKVRNVTFRGIAFEHSSWLAPSQHGYVDMQAGFRYQTAGGGNTSEIRGTARYAAPRAMIQLSNCSRITLEDSAFQFSGSWGVMGYEGTDHTMIARNLFFRNAGGGVAMGIVGDRWDDNDNAAYSAPDRQSQFDVITDNLIDSVSADYKDMAGIGAMIPRGMVISRNEIRNLPYTGISIGWNWSDNDHGCTNNTVSKNRIHRVVRLLQDGAGIYSLGRMPGSEFSENYIYDMASQSPYAAYNVVIGIYFDNGSAFKTAHKNVIDRVVSAFFVSNPPNHNNVISSNYYNGEKGWISEANFERDNAAVKDQAWPAEAQRIMREAGPRIAFPSQIR